MANNYEGLIGPILQYGLDISLASFKNGVPTIPFEQALECAVCLYAIANSGEVAGRYDAYSDNPSSASDYLSAVFETIGPRSVKIQRLHAKAEILGQESAKDELRKKAKEEVEAEAKAKATPIPTAGPARPSSPIK